jgi:hypothetical protein
MHNRVRDGIKGLEEVFLEVVQYITSSICSIALVCNAATAADPNLLQYVHPCE